MLVKWIVMGGGGLVLAVSGILFKFSHEPKIQGFRKTASKVNGYLYSNNRLKDVWILEDPKHDSWNEKFSIISSSSELVSVLPESARTNSEAMIDWCFKEIENRSEEAKDLHNIDSDQKFPTEKEVWGLCLSTRVRE